MAGKIKGISVHQTRFALLSIDSDSEEEETEQNWQFAGSKSGSGSGRRKRNDSDRNHSNRHHHQVAGSKEALKNAKKRQRKKNRSQSGSSDGNPEDSLKQQEYLQTWKERNKEAMESEYQKDLEEAIMLSMAEAEDERQRQLEAMRNYAQIRASAHQTEAMSVADEAGAQIAAVTQTATVAAAGKTKNKKGVTLSLQEFNRGGVDAVLLPLGNSPTEEECVDERSPPGVSELWNEDDWGDDSAFFDKVHSDVQQQLVKEEHQVSTKRKPRAVAEIVSDRPSESVRVAQLQDELEKKEEVIQRISEENKKLQEELSEVKKRNQRLCRILSKGEFATKTELIQQIEEIAAMKDELATEIESLHALLEQERSKNKILKLEVAKLQGTKTGSKS